MRVQEGRLSWELIWWFCRLLGVLISPVTWQKHNRFLLSQLQARETAMPRELALPRKRAAAGETIWSDLASLPRVIYFAGSGGLQDCLI